MNTLKKQYRDLEMRVMNELRSIIEQSEYKAKTHEAKAIKLVGRVGEDFPEIAIINDQLTPICRNGYTYSIFDFSMESLIDIINEHRPEL